MSSLQDQLLKAGLVDAKKAKQVSKQKRKSQKVQHKSKVVVEDEAKLAAAQVRAEKIERDRSLNDARKAEADKKAIAAQIKQLITLNQIPKGSGDGLLGYNFTHGKLIKKLYVSPKIQQQLERGQLAIVSLNESYELVPAPVAEKISQRDSSCVVSVQQLSTESVEDDPYADYQIPDDLMW